ncbi:MAG: sodium:alanine symporter family protein [Peptostreptococcaceae bacterium]|nr:sodium:alanine symporter family protein [Peptostreptococcaceae bacterium]
MSFITKANEFLNGIVWGPYMIGLLLFTGIVLTIQLHFIQVFNFSYILRNTIGKMFRKPTSGEGDISSGQAGLTAIAAVVGTGNIAGVATAIAMGGPGAVFWMWVSAFFGMATKFSEIALGIKYREKRADNTYSGGAMYYLDKGMNNKFMAYFFSVMVLITYFIMGAIVDTNSMVLSLEEQWRFKPLISGIALSFLAGIVILGGIKRMGKVCEILAPFMGGLYILAGIFILLLNIRQLPAALFLIIKSAFTPVAAAGGFVGSTIATTVKMGFARGMFSNEAGMGSSPIIHSSATVNHPVEQGIWGVAEVFVDTFLICSITGITIVMSGEWLTGVSGPALTMRAFNALLPGNIGSYIVMGSAVLFGYSCLISANFYCERAGEYLFGSKVILPIRILWVIFIVIGSVGGLEFVWDLADTANGLMAIPNLIGLLVLSKTAVNLKNDFFSRKDKI